MFTYFFSRLSMCFIKSSCAPVTNSRALSLKTLPLMASIVGDGALVEDVKVECGLPMDISLGVDPNGEKGLFAAAEECLKARYGRFQWMNLRGISPRSAEKRKGILTRYF